MQGESLARAVKRIKHTIQKTLDIAIRLEIDIQMVCCGDDGDAALGIVLVSDAFLHPATCQASTTLTYFLFAYDNQFFR